MPPSNAFAVMSRSPDAAVNEPTTYANIDVNIVPIQSLRPADSPRLSGADESHVRLLAEAGTALPPIVVHRRSMRIVDGTHRVRAALLRGETTIRARFVDGSEREAFVLAVRANVAHGLPLPLTDRELAAERIIESYPNWSDRAIAEVTGLAPSTVAKIRENTGDGAAREGVRIGRDGRARPLDGAAGRVVASEIIARRPDASLREVAREAGISPATARDVRVRMQRGDDPVPEGYRSRQGRRPASRRPEPDGAAVVFGSETVDPGDILRRLSADPSLRYSDSGRALWRWLMPRVVGLEGWPTVVEAVPPHCAYSLVKLARRCADDWTALAERLEEKIRMTE